AWGACPALDLSYGLASRTGGALAAAAPSFTALSPALGLDYFGVFDGGRSDSDGACCRHLKERLHGAVAQQVERELLAEAPRFLIQGGVEGWWRTTMAEAFRAVDQELVGVDVGARALVAQVLKDYIVLANRGVSRAVLCRGGVAVQLTASEHYRGLEVTAVARDPRDEFLILATAGLWNHVSPAAACALVAQRLRATARATRPTTPWLARVGSRGTPAVLAEELAEHAGSEGEGTVSVVVVLFRDFWADPTAAAPHRNR
ncbi:hypothetical protein BRADI_2g07145v3, partial [Brachypodium distachyon]